MHVNSNSRTKYIQISIRVDIYVFSRNAGSSFFPIIHINIYVPACNINCLRARRETSTPRNKYACIASIQINSSIKNINITGIGMQRLRIMNMCSIYSYIRFDINLTIKKTATDIAVYTSGFQDKIVTINTNVIFIGISRPQNIQITISGDG